MMTTQPADTVREPLGTPPQVASYLGKPVATLKQWRWEGKGPRYLRVGRDVRYRWEDVDEWLAGQAEGGAE